MAGGLRRRTLDVVVAITAGHYTGALQTAIPAAILNRLVLPAVHPKP